jgi:TatD DNase family protein
MISSLYIDAHCHLADPKFSLDLEAVLDRSEKAGVGEWIQGGVGPEDWEAQKKISRLKKGLIHLAFGLHPWWVASQSEGNVISALKQLENELGKARCLGELGLDFLPQFKSKAQVQKEVFRAQLILNEKFKKPLILHIVQAHSEAIHTLKEFRHQRGLVHAFSEGKEVLRQYLDLGFLISVGGAVTRKGYQKLKESLSFIPPERLVIETDAPDQTPEVAGFSKGIRNEPCTLVPIAEAISQIRKDLSPEALLDSSSRNLRALLASSSPSR